MKGSIKTTNSKYSKKLLEKGKSLSLRARTFVAKHFSLFFVYLVVFFVLFLFLLIFSSFFSSLVCGRLRELWSTMRCRWRCWMAGPTTPQRSSFALAHDLLREQANHIFSSFFFFNLFNHVMCGHAISRHHRIFNIIVHLYSNQYQPSAHLIQQKWL